MQPPQRITSASDMSSPFSNCNPRNCCLALPVIQFLKIHQTECKFCPAKLITINYTNKAVKTINYLVNFDKKRYYKNPSLSCWPYLLFHTGQNMHRVWLIITLSPFYYGVHNNRHLQYREQDFSARLTFPAIFAFPCIFSSLASSGRRLSKTVETTCESRNFCFTPL